MNRDESLNVIRQDIDDGNHIMAGYLALIFEQGQKQGPLTEDEQRAAFNEGVNALIAKSLRREQTGL